MRRGDKGDGREGSVGQNGGGRVNGLVKLEGWGKGCWR